MSHGIHNKFVAVSGFISLTMAGCVHHAGADKSGPVTASAQGLPAPGLLARLSGKGGTGVVHDLSQWPEKPDESRTKAKFNQLFPHLSQRLERRSLITMSQPLAVASEAPAVSPSAQSAPAAVAVNDSAAAVAATPVANSVTPSAQNGQVASSPAVSPSAQAAPAVAVGLPSVQEAAPATSAVPAAAAAAPVPPATENTPAPKVEAPSSLPPIDSPAAPPEIKPTVVPETQPATAIPAAKPAETTAAPAANPVPPTNPAPAAPVVPAPPAIPAAPPANPAPVPPAAPAANPVPPANPAPAAPVVPAPPAIPAAPPANPAPVPTPAANPQPAVPAIPSPAPVPPPANPVPARPSAEPPARPEPKKPSEELSLAPPAIPSSTVQNPAENLPVPGIPVAEPASPKPAPASTPVVQAQAPALSDSPPAMNPPPVPAEEIAALPAPTQAKVATAPVLQPEIPAIPAVDQKPAVSAPVAEIAPANQPEPPAIPQLALKPPAEPASTPPAELARAPLAKPAETPDAAQLPAPAPAPEMDIPAIPKADEAQPALQSKEQTSDPGVKRLSADAGQVNQETATAQAQPEPTPPPATSPDSAEIKAPTDEQPVKVLQPLPDEEESEPTQAAEKTSGILSRSENGLVIHFELKNPLRRWINRQSDEPIFRPRQSGLASLRATTRDFYEKSRTTLASRLIGSANEKAGELPVKQSVVEQSPQVVTESAAKPVESPAQAPVETAATDEKPGQAVAAQPAAPDQAQSAAQPATAIVQPVRASTDSQKPAPTTRTAAYSPSNSRPRVVTTTSSGLPPVEFPPTYGQNRTKSANPWANKANPAVPPRITPDLAVASYDMLKSTKPGSESKKPAKADRSIIATSMVVPIAKPGPVTPQPAKAEASKPAPSEKASTGPSLFMRAGTGLKSFFFGEDEVVPAKRQNWSTQNWSGSDRPGMAQSGMLPGKNPGFNRLSPGM